jgi:WS/DGAT/MGAT family acyltransferase
VSSVGFLNFSENPQSSRTTPIWAAERPRKARSDKGSRRPFGPLPSVILEQARALPNLLQGLTGSAKAAIGLKSDPDFTSVAEAPRTILNTNITPQRRVATQATTLQRMKAIGEAADGSVNDVLLAACSGALRRYLGELDKLPSKSLITSIPVALPRDATHTGNAISFANVRLGTDLEDVRERFDVIRRSSAAGRAYLKQMGPLALMEYTVLMSSPQMITRLPGIGARMPPIYNVIISNVPGPRHKLYLLGAEIEASYPISALAHGQALNITVMSYAGGLYFGFTACRDRVPSVQRLAVYTGEALDELESVFVGGKKGRAAKAGRARATGRARRPAPARPARQPAVPLKARRRPKRASRSNRE